MTFFFILWGATLAALAIDRFGIASLSSWQARMRVGLSIALLLAGIDHMITPERYIPMIERFLPHPFEIVFVTGVLEILGALGLCVPRVRRAAGIGLAVYFICVYPANIANAIYGLDAPGLPSTGWYYWVRLALQPIAISWALVGGEVVHIGARTKGQV